MSKYKTTVSEFQLKKVKTDFPKVKIGNSLDAATFIRQFYGDDLGIFESFFILLLNRGNTTMGFAKISQGGIAGTIVDTKIIAKYAVESLCSFVILAHNHPSGRTKPSQQDINITKKVKDAMALLEIEVLDHIILTEENHLSMADDGFM